MRCVLVAIVVLVPVAFACAQVALTPQQRWESILPYFAPPKEYAGQLGEYRSVMKFDDGTPVARPEDWPKRRAEIRAYWESKMGTWPPLLEKPTVEFIAKEHVENFTRHKARLQVASQKIQDVLILVPDGAGPFPAVLVVYYEPETPGGVDTKRPTSMFGYDLARRGFVTLCLGGVDNDVRRPDNGGRPCQPLYYMAYAAANAHTALAQMPQVDPRRIGIMGHSFGSKWAMFASCFYDKFAAAVWCDGGIVWNEKDPNANYWDSWYLGWEKGTPRKGGNVTESNPRTGAYKELVEEKHDMNEIHALMAPRPFLVSGGDQDQPEHWPALNSTIALYKFLGYENRIAMTNRQGHAPTVESNEQAYRFLEHFLKDM